MLQLDKTTEVQYNTLFQPIKIIEPINTSNIQSVDYLIMTAKAGYRKKTGFLPTLLTAAAIQETSNIPIIPIIR
ncbi:hypothetical protein [uncultured Chryseobacterium sp.]|uniref:hypothetical protein n=1 Tax=uncultured Chryseobacterium sp. TaxID=259322 RepID=UPI0025E1DE03|nr:hypothetical protein [uncultured Chryseobacterium sp.]